jgi:SAM-dependent methyltransferase
MIDKNSQGQTIDQWADYYDLLDIDRTEMIEFYKSLITYRTKSLLELGCGTGTVTIACARQLRRQTDEYRVVGIDISAAMLRIAQKGDDTIEWVCDDIRSPHVSGSFDLIICCFNTLQELLTEEDLGQMLRSVRGLLNPSGLFAFDIYQPNLEYLSHPRFNRIARLANGTGGERLEVREDYVFDPASEVLTIEWRLHADNMPERVVLPPLRYFYRQYSATAIERHLSAAGFDIQKKFGGFDGSALTKSSKKQVAVCRVSDPTARG